MTQRPLDFSVIVPTRARPAALARCLEALERQEPAAGEVEVVVVADGEDPGIEQAAARFGDRGRLKTIVQSRAGPAAARNAGAEHASGTLLAFTDDDCVPAPDWLTRLRDRLEATPGVVVGGRTLNGVEGNVYSSASQLVVDALYSYYNAGERAGFFTTNNLGLAADDFASVGGFDASFPFAGGEDREFSDRCLERGHRLEYAPEAVVHHFNRLALGSFLRQHFTYGRGAAHFHRARARRGLGRLTVEPRFYLTLLGAPFARYGVRGAPLAGLAAVTQAAYAAGFALEELKLRRR